MYGASGVAASDTRVYPLNAPNARLSGDPPMHTNGRLKNSGDVGQMDAARVAKMAQVAKSGASQSQVAKSGVSQSYDELNKMLRVSLGMDQAINAKPMRPDDRAGYYHTLLFGDDTRRKEVELEKMNLKRRLDATTSLTSMIGSITDHIQSQIMEKDQELQALNGAGSFISCSTCCATNDPNAYHIVGQPYTYEQEIAPDSMNMQTEITELRRQLALAEAQLTHLSSQLGTASNAASGADLKAILKEHKRRAIARFAGIFAQGKEAIQHTVFCGWVQVVKQSKMEAHYARQNQHNNAAADNKYNALIGNHAAELAEAKKRPPDSRKEALLVKFGARFMSDGRRGMCEVVFTIWHKYAAKMQERGRGRDHALKLAPENYYLDVLDHNRKDNKRCCG